MRDDGFLPPAPGEARIVSTPDTRGGRPRIDGTRIAVSDVLHALRQGVAQEALCTHFVRHLTPAQIEAAMAYAAAHPDEMAAEEAKDHAFDEALQARIERSRRHYGVFVSHASIPEAIRKQTRETAKTEEGWIPLLPEENS